MTKPTYLALAFALALAGCDKKKSEGLEPPQPAPPTPAADAAAGSGSAGSAASAEQDRTTVEGVGFMTPESVLYDADADVYLVANINQSDKTSDKDDNGFISKVSPDGKVAELKWIDGAKPDVSLDAPKGMAISGGVLWVADLVTVRKFDAKTGKPMGEVKVTGSTFLNDVAVDGDGGVYVTDSGEGSNAVYHVTKAGKVTALVKDEGLGGPNGVALVDSQPIVVTRGGEILKVPAKGPVTEREKLPAGQLDGVIALGGGEVLVSSWANKTVFRGKPFGDKPTEWTDLKLGIEGPADIGYDTKRDRLLVPHFDGNALTIVGIGR